MLHCPGMGFHTRTAAMEASSARTQLRSPFVRLQTLSCTWRGYLASRQWLLVGAWVWPQQTCSARSACHFCATWGCSKRDQQELHLARGCAASSLLLIVPAAALSLR